VRQTLDNTPIHIDEFGTLSFSVYQENGYTYEFEQAAHSDYLFITMRDDKHRAIGKRVVNTTTDRNKEIVEIYKDYLKEQDDITREQNSDDG